MKNIVNYSNIKFVQINNYKIDKQGFKILKEHKEKFENVKYLNIWNIKQNDLELLELCSNVTHLLISYIGKADFSYKGLDYLNKLETIVLSSVNKIIDFNFLTTSQKEKIKYLHLTYTASLTKFDGIEDFQNLETLTLFASTMESRKTVNIESLNGLEKLSNLRSFEIDYFTNVHCYFSKVKLNNIEIKLTKREYEGWSSPIYYFNFKEPVSNFGKQSLIKEIDTKLKQKFPEYSLVDYGILPLGEEIDE